MAASAVTTFVTTSLACAARAAAIGSFFFCCSRTLTRSKTWHRRKSLIAVLPAWASVGSNSAARSGWRWQNCRSIAGRTREAFRDTKSVMAPWYNSTTSGTPLPDAASARTRYSTPEDAHSASFVSADSAAILKAAPQMAATRSRSSSGTVGHLPLEHSLFLTSPSVRCLRASLPPSPRAARLAHSSSGTTSSKSSGDSGCLRTKVSSKSRIRSRKLLLCLIDSLRDGAPVPFRSLNCSAIMLSSFIMRSSSQSDRSDPESSSSESSPFWCCSPSGSAATPSALASASRSSGSTASPSMSSPSESSPSSSSSSLSGAGPASAPPSSSSSSPSSSTPSRRRLLRALAAADPPSPSTSSSSTSIPASPESPRSCSSRSVTALRESDPETTPKTWAATVRKDADGRDRKLSKMSTSIATGSGASPSPSAAAFVEKMSVHARSRSETSSTSASSRV
mmetsp:Transcript_6986/g.17937  ORF Transcript_6986/g.17937 Transcript_6986/m.17937 type:complete len:452 (+) Transcript_6986:817-2172(+)